MLTLDVPRLLGVFLAAVLLAREVGAAGEESPPRPVCVAAETCTLVRTTSMEGGTASVVLLDRNVPRPDLHLPFAGWMAWPQAPATFRTTVWKGRALRIERTTEVGTFLLRAVPSVRVANEPEALLVLLTVDPLRTGPADTLPEPIAIAEERALLTSKQQAATASERQAAQGRTKALTNAWTAYVRAPAERASRIRLLEALGADRSALEPETFLTPEQRTALRRAGLALEGRIFVEDGTGPHVSYTLRVEGVSLEQLVREWNAGLSALVNPLERVPRPLLLVSNALRHEEVSFRLDVQDGDPDRMSQVVRRLLAIPGLTTEGKQLPPPGL